MGEESTLDNKQNGDIPIDWYETSLPKPPVPTLEHTLERYMEYARVIAESYNIPLRPTKEAVEDFLENHVGIQKKLTEIAENDENWVNRYWLPEMYLKARYPLPVNSNPAYIFPKRDFKDEDEQISYAAWLIRGFIEYKNKIDKKHVEREVALSRDGAKLCMNQYDRILSCYREPNTDIDTLFYRRENPDHFGDPRNEHIIVMCNEQAFVVYVKLDDQLISHTEIVHQLKEVHKKAKSRLKSTLIPVSAGSAGERNNAAKFWNLMKTEPTNTKSLNWTRAATFVLCLDFLDHEKHPKTDEISRLEHAGHLLLHGYGSKHNGLNRWYDATIQVIVSSDGTSGLCIEHSVAEGIVIINMVESALRFYEKNKHYQNKVQPSLCLNPKPLRWSVDEESKILLEKQRAEFDGLAEDLELTVLNFTDFGKNKIKSASVSPDGFCQLIMQLAHYRLHGRLVSSYESAAIRRFKYGRVDNIRAATPEALEWVKKMDDPKMSKECKKTAFYSAAAKQAKVTLENITGYGIDNHLCALQVLSTEAVSTGQIAKIPEIFTNKIWHETMRFPLSTSQVTTSPDISGSYLCYGPVVQDGYGCSYNIQPDKLIFATSCRKSCPETNAKRFKDELTNALCDTMSLIEPKK